MILETQVLVGAREGLKSPSAIHCDNLASLPRSALTNHKGALSPDKMRELGEALAAALGID